LDFGCGVGRLTQALARRFAACTGVDISEEMIRKAEAINRYPHCSYLANSATTLPFADATFGFIYSNIVLQHVPPRFSEQYLREFVRVLAPGGLLVFGVQDSFAVRDLSSLQARIRLTLRPRSRIKNALGIGQADMRMHCLPEPAIRRALSSAKGQAKIVDIQFTNTAAKDFNGKLVYLHEPPLTGFISRQYCAIKP
jgi:ubiquinone/menaquinone biosynthesis C-methylase UbiE